MSRAVWILIKMDSLISKVSVIPAHYVVKSTCSYDCQPLSQGTNGKASDKALYKMEGELESNRPTIELEEPKAEFGVRNLMVVSEAEKKSYLINSSYTLNDYFLPRVVANLYVSGIWNPKILKVTMTNGDYQQIGFQISLIGSMVVIFTDPHAQTPNQD